MNPNIFKAYDIRGKYPEEINARVIQVISLALGGFFKSGKVVVGHDVRFGSLALYQAASHGLKKSNSKLKIIEAGLMTTPMLYFLVNYFRASGGLMVTASHSPKEINGLKVVGPKAAPLSGRDILKLLR